MRISDWSSDVFSSDLSAWWRFFPAGASSAPRPAHSAMRLIYALSLPSRRLQQRLENLVGGRNHLRRRLIRLLESQQVRGLFIEIDAGHRVTRSRGLRRSRRLRVERKTRLQIGRAS